jgi:hypothetical protein
LAVLNDYGDAGVYRVEQAAQQLATQLGIQKEVIYGFFNDNGRFPGSLQELETWGNTPDRIYGIRRRQGPERPRFPPRHRQRRGQPDPAVQGVRPEHPDRATPDPGGRRRHAVPDG